MLGLILVCFEGLLAQNTPNTELPFHEFYKYVVENHPVIKQANLEPDYASTELMQARGLFDPKLISELNRKSLNGKDYYTMWVTDLKVPVWSGIDFKAGREENLGSYLPTDLTKGVSMYAGVSVPLGRNFLIDERRSTLEQAKIYKELGKIKQQKLLNKLIFTVSKDYWEWYLAHQKLKYINEGYVLAKNRFEFVKEQVLVGEKAGIDSVEAKITLQTREVELQSAQIDFTNTGLLLSTHLWQENTPVEISEKTIPAPYPAIDFTDEMLQRLTLYAKQQHPEIMQLNLTYNQLLIEEKFRKEQLKPLFNASFYALNTPKYNFFDYSLLQTNHKISLNFEMPLLLRKERGKLEQVRIKQLQNELDKRQLSREIITSVNQNFNELTTFKNLLKIQLAALENQDMLVKAEQEKFRIGESNLFLINSRESKLIEMKIKVEEIKSKYQKSLAQLIYSAGLSSINF